jgi:hypothetical protein
MLALLGLGVVIFTPKMDSPPMTETALVARAQ